MLAHKDVCSRRPLIEHYDRFVRGATVIPSGYADAGVFIIKRGGRAGIALSVDGNPRYGAISAKLGAAHAVVEAARNVAAVGALPIGLTDCLNYGNPEDPIAYRQLVDGIDGLAEAATALQLSSRPGEPLPFVSGNVSLYNESAAGAAIAPSAIVACIGRVADVARVVTMKLSGPNNQLYLLGRRAPQLGGSVLEALHGNEEDELPPLDYAEANSSIRSVINAIREGVISAAHDISDGGLLACVAEMCLGGDADGVIGVRLDAPAKWAPGVAPYAALFGETPGFVVEVADTRRTAFEWFCGAQGAEPIVIGRTGGESIYVEGESCDVPLRQAAAEWTQPLKALYA